MIDILRLSSRDRERALDIMAVLDRQQAASEKVRALREYYDGIHPVLLTQRQQQFLGGLTSHDQFPFAHNLVRAVINTLAERLSVSAVSVNGENERSGNQTAATLWEWWKRNRLDEVEQRVYINAMRDGKAYLMVDYDRDNDRPRFSLHPLDDGDTGIIMRFDPADDTRVLYATRYFRSFDAQNPGLPGIERRTIYLESEIRKYQRRSSVGTWEPVMDEGDESWPIPWVDSTGRPLGVAVIEFANPAGPEAEQIIGLQNALNKAWLDLIAAADTNGFPILVAEYTNGVPFGPSGSDSNIEGSDELNISPARVVELTGATMKRIEAADLGPMLEIIWGITSAVAGISRTPQYYLRPVGSTEAPSGESLKQLESGLVTRAKRSQRVFGQAWEDAMLLAMRVANTFGPYSFNNLDDMTIDVQWVDPETRNDMVVAQTAQIRQLLNVPNNQIWTELGYTPEQIVRFEQEMERKRAQEMSMALSTLRTTRGDEEQNVRAGATLDGQYQLARNLPFGSASLRNGGVDAQSRNRNGNGNDNGNFPRPPRSPRPAPAR